ncbi:hypothetical protein IPM65_03460 [Candidatus Roizmanbacteria bacterium]|nr:MAG: hypothetical protein IPM65_03460 [Candidatus Roizmanbacteria bacterium]
MHRFLLCISVIGLASYCLFSAPGVHAQIDLDLLLNSPTPTPLPPGQEYILELEQLDLSTASDSGKFGSFSTAERKRFEEQGYTVRSKDQPISFSIDRTQIAFSSFETAPVQEEQSSVHISAESSGFQVLMEAKAAFSSENDTTIPPTRCDSRRTCSALRAQSWKNEQIPGWGYSVSGNNAPSDFQDKTFYRPPSFDGIIALLKQGEPAKRSSITLNWKIVTEALNDETYSSVVTLFALPY